MENLGNSFTKVIKFPGARSRSELSSDNINSRNHGGSNLLGTPTKTKGKPSDAKYFCVFNSAAHMRIWTFCSKTKTTLTKWRKAHFEQWHRYPDSRDLETPNTDSLNERLELDPLTEIKYQTDSDMCPLCFDTGYIYEVVGPILIDDTPGKLLMVKCPMHRRETAKHPKAIRE
jgi:hypothetical protein